mmetsp:Transcript_22999/g.35541  ORF Transcript_22999/g.35541 Transcript_22999/m.35541 type:complete len:107 (+) Transcript_22999:5968-6288(+)
MWDNGEELDYEEREKNTFIELQIELNLTIMLVVRNILLRHYVMVYIGNFILVVSVFIIEPMFLKPFFFAIVFGQVSYALMIAVLIHQREMIFRKCLNYERILEVEA